MLYFTMLEKFMYFKTSSVHCIMYVNLSNYVLINTFENSMKSFTEMINKTNLKLNLNH